MGRYEGTCWAMSCRLPLRWRWTRSFCVMDLLWVTVRSQVAPQRMQVALLPAEGRVRVDRWSRNAPWNGDELVDAWVGWVGETHARCRPWLAPRWCQGSKQASCQPSGGALCPVRRAFFAENRSSPGAGVRQGVALWREVRQLVSGRPARCEEALRLRPWDGDLVTDEPVSELDEALPAVGAEVVLAVGRQHRATRVFHQASAIRTVR